MATAESSRFAEILTAAPWWHHPLGFCLNSSTVIPGGASIKEATCQCRRHKRCRFDPWVGMIFWRGVWQPTLVFLPGESHGQRSLAGYSHGVSQSHAQLKWVSVGSPSHPLALLTAAAAAAKSLQSCPTLCDPIDSSPPGSPVPGILQARTQEWVTISFSNAWKWKVKVKLLCRVRLLATPWTAAYQAPPSMGFSRQEYWSGVPLPSPLLTAVSPKAHLTSNSRMYGSGWPCHQSYLVH